MDCNFCNKKTSVFLSHKGDSFCICNKCLSKLPYYFSKRIDDYTYEEVCGIFRWEQEHKAGLKQVFFTTSAYGAFHIDSLHHLICIGQDGDFEKGKPVGNDPLIIEIEKLSGLSFDVDVEKASSEEIKGSILLSCSVEEPAVEIRNAVIKKGVTITPTMMDNNTVSYTLPPEVQLMWNEILEAREKMEQHSFLLQGNKKELYKAMGLYMVEDFFTKDQLKKQRNLLVKAFHPDSDASEGAEERSQAVIKAYELLKPYAKEQ